MLVEVRPGSSEWQQKRDTHIFTKVALKFQAALPFGKAVCNPGSTCKLSFRCKRLYHFSGKIDISHCQQNKLEIHMNRDGLCFISILKTLRF